MRLWRKSIKTGKVEIFMADHLNPPIYRLVRVDPFKVAPIKHTGSVEAFTTGPSSAYQKDAQLDVSYMHHLEGVYVASIIKPVDDVQAEVFERALGRYGVKVTRTGVDQGNIRLTKETDSQANGRLSGMGVSIDIGELGIKHSATTVLEHPLFGGSVVTDHGHPMGPLFAALAIRGHVTFAALDKNTIGLRSARFAPVDLSDTIQTVITDARFDPVWREFFEELGITSRHGFATAWKARWSRHAASSGRALLM